MQVFTIQILNAKKQNKNTEHFGVFFMILLTEISIDVNLEFENLVFIFETVFEML